MVGFFYCQSEIYQVQTFGTPKVYKLVKLAQNSLDPEEVTFVVHSVKTLQRGSELREMSERNVGGVRESRRRVGKSERYHAGVKTWLQL